MNSEKPLFSTASIRRLIFPLIVEQLLAVMVGMADTIMIASVGEQAVSGVSVVDILNMLLIQVFAALATGGAVVSSHYLGSGEREKACKAADQLILVITVLSSAIMVIALIFNYQLLIGIYGNLETDVLSYARTYFYITAVSFPFLAIYNGSAAICRSMGNSQLSMKVAFLMNGLNIAGNALLIFVFKMEVAGAAYSTLFSRIVAAVIMLLVVRDQKLELHIDRYLRFGFNPHMIKKILAIGLPVAVENSLFQGGKLIVAGLVSTFGTASIAANAVGNNIASFQTMPGQAIGLAVITIVGQTIGAKRYDEAKKYAVKMCFLVMIAHAALAIPMTLALPLIIKIYNLSDITAQLATSISLLHGICCIFIWPASFTLPNAFRAADDAKFTMFVAIGSMVGCRVIMSYVLGRNMGLGLFGVWVAMILDWLVRDTIFIYRFISGGWLKKYRMTEQNKL